MGWNLWVEDANLEICTTSLHTTHVYANNIPTKQPMCGWSLNGFVVGSTNIGSSVRQLSVSFELKDAAALKKLRGTKYSALTYPFVCVGCVRTSVSEENSETFSRTVMEYLHITGRELLASSRNLKLYISCIYYHEHLSSCSVKSRVAALLHRSV